MQSSTSAAPAAKPRISPVHLVRVLPAAEVRAIQLQMFRMQAVLGTLNKLLFEERCGLDQCDDLVAILLEAGDRAVGNVLDRIDPFAVKGEGAGHE